MKKHSKLLSTSLIVALSLASLQASHGIDRSADEDTSLGVTLSVATSPGAPTIDQEGNGMNGAVVEPLQTLRCNPSEAREPGDTSTHPVIDLKRNHFPVSIGLLILKHAVMGLCCEFNNANKFANVSKGWLAFIKGERPEASKEYAFHFSKDVLEEYTPKTFEECCQLQVFLNGRFVFLI